jgi:hypothetical protein
MGKGNLPAMELRFTMVPFLSRRIPGKQLCVTRIRENRFTSNIFLTASMETSSSVPRMLKPALLMSTDTGCGSFER